MSGMSNNSDGFEALLARALRALASSTSGFASTFFSRAIAIKPALVSAFDVTRSEAINFFAIGRHTFGSQSDRNFPFVDCYFLCRVVKQKSSRQTSQRL